MTHQVRTVSSMDLRSAYGELADRELRAVVRRALAVFLDLERG